MSKDELSNHTLSVYRLSESGDCGGHEMFGFFNDPEHLAPDVVRPDVAEVWDCCICGSGIRLFALSRRLQIRVHPRLTQEQIAHALRELAGRVEAGLIDEIVRGSVEMRGGIGELEDKGSPF